MLSYRQRMRLLHDEAVSRQEKARICRIHAPARDRPPGLTPAARQIVDVFVTTERVAVTAVKALARDLSRSPDGLLELREPAPPPGAPPAAGPSRPAGKTVVDVAQFAACLPRHLLAVALLPEESTPESESMPAALSALPHWADGLTPRASSLGPRAAHLALGLRALHVLAQATARHAKLGHSLSPHGPNAESITDLLHLLLLQESSRAGRPGPHPAERAALVASALALPMTLCAESLAHGAAFLAQGGPPGAMEAAFDAVRSVLGCLAALVWALPSPGDTLTDYVPATATATATAPAPPPAPSALPAAVTATTATATAHTTPQSMSVAEATAVAVGRAAVAACVGLRSMLRGSRAPYASLFAHSPGGDPALRLLQCALRLGIPPPGRQRPTPPAARASLAAAAVAAVSAFSALCDRPPAAHALPLPPPELSRVPDWPVDAMAAHARPLLDAAVAAAAELGRRGLCRAVGPGAWAESAEETAALRLLELFSDDTHTRGDVADALVPALAQCLASKPESFAALWCGGFAAVAIHTPPASPVGGSGFAGGAASAWMWGSSGAGALAAAERSALLLKGVANLAAFNPLAQCPSSGEGPGDLCARLRLALAALPSPAGAAIAAAAKNLAALAAHARSVGVASCLSTARSMAAGGGAWGGMGPAFLGGILPELAPYDLEDDAAIVTDLGESLASCCGPQETAAAAQGGGRAALAAGAYAAAEAATAKASAARKRRRAEVAAAGVGGTVAPWVMGGGDGETRAESGDKPYKAFVERRLEQLAGSGDVETVCRRIVAEWAAGAR